MMLLASVAFVGGVALSGSDPALGCQIKNLVGIGPRCYYVLLTVNVGATVCNANGCSTQDVHNVVYNTGATWLEAQFTNTNPTGGGNMKFIALSNNGASPASGDSVSGVECGGTGNQLTTNGAASGAGTITLGSGASPQTLTIAKTFTATGAFTVQKSCLMNESTIDANDQQFASALFTTATLASGDTIAVTWTLTFTY